MWIDSFINYLKFEKHFSDHTSTCYRIDLCEFSDYMKEYFHEKPVEEAESREIRRWITHLMDRKLKATTVNRKLSSLKSFYKYLQYKRIITRNPASLIKGPEKKKPLPVFIREEEMEKVLCPLSEEEASFETIRDTLILETFYATGMRLSELIGLQDADVDLFSCVFKVTGKRNKQRLIPFGEELKNHLENYILFRNQAMKDLNIEAFFIRKNGKAMYPSFVYKLVKCRLSKAVTVRKKSPHVLRHTFATAMLNHNASLNAVKEILGHESLETTEIYTHTTFEELKKVYNQAHPRA